ncbi:MAG: DUF2092 domain-containing protein [Deltaproteobacteria bacterium]|nr:DUF2092 domain-containing protein [Deltaproteobacteria bacterium]
MKIRTCCFGFFLMAVAMSAVSVVDAQQSGKTAPMPTASAMDVLRRMGDFLSRQPKFSVTITDAYDVLQASGQKIEFGDVRRLTIVRPDRLRLDVLRSDGDKAQITFDGRVITVYSPNHKVYGVSYVPKDIDGAVAHFIGELQMRLPLAMLFVSRLPQEILRRVISAEIVEISAIMDPPCFHVAARTDQVDFQLWVPAQGDPLPRRVVITYKNEPGQPQFHANFADWNLAPEAPENLFVLAIPQDARRIEFLPRMQPAVKPAAKKGGKK